MFVILMYLIYILFVFLGNLQFSLKDLSNLFLELPFNSFDLFEFQNFIQFDLSDSLEFQAIYNDPRRDFLPDSQL